MKRATYQIREAKASYCPESGLTVAPAAWYYVLVGANGEVMNSSELYPSRENAKRGAQDAKKASRFAKVDK